MWGAHLDLGLVQYCAKVHLYIKITAYENMSSVYMSVYVWVCILYNYVHNHIHVASIPVSLLSPHNSPVQFLPLSWGSLLITCSLNKGSWEQLGSFSLVQWLLRGQVEGRTNDTFIVFCPCSKLYFYFTSDSLTYLPPPEFQGPLQFSCDVIRTIVDPCKNQKWLSSVASWGQKLYPV